MSVKFAHNDYTRESAPKRVRDLFPAKEANLIYDDRIAEMDSRGFDQSQAGALPSGWRATMPCG